MCILCHAFCFLNTYTVGEIRIKHITNFLNKYISKRAIHKKLSPEIKPQISINYVKCNNEKWHREKVFRHEEREAKAMESHDKLKSIQSCQSCSTDGLQKGVSFPRCHTRNKNIVAQHTDGLGSRISKLLSTVGTITGSGKNIISL